MQKSTDTPMINCDGCWIAAFSEICGITLCEEVKLSVEETAPVRLCQVPDTDAHAGVDIQLSVEETEPVRLQSSVRPFVSDYNTENL